MPIVGANPLTAFQWQYGSVVMGDGTSYEVVGAHGFDDLPVVRVQDVARGRDHGLWRGTDYAQGRTCVLDVEVIGTDDTSFRTNVEALIAATVVASPTLGSVESPLVFMLPGMTGNRQIGVRPRRRLLPHDLDYKFHKAKITVEFAAVDPRVYDANQSSVTIPVAIANTGFTFNASFNLTFGAGTGGGGTVQAVNNGNFPTRPVLTITGPVDNPSIQNVTTGQTLSFAISLVSTDVLTLDLDAKSVILNGTATRRSTLVGGSTWWELAPGTSTIQYTANTVQVGSGCTMTWRSAWL